MYFTVERYVLHAKFSRAFKTLLSTQVSAKVILLYVSFSHIFFLFLNLFINYLQFGLLYWLQLRHQKSCIWSLTLLSEFLEDSERILIVIHFACRLSNDIMCDCVHREAIDLYELFRELVENEVLLTTEEALKEGQRLWLLLYFGFRTLFSGH